MAKISVTAQKPPLEKAQGMAATVRQDVLAANSIAALREQVTDLAEAVELLTREIERRG